MKMLKSTNGIENKIIFMIDCFEMPQLLLECNTIEEGIEAYKKFNNDMLEYDINSITLIDKNNLIAQKIKVLNKCVDIKKL